MGYNKLSKNECADLTTFIKNYITNEEEIKGFLLYRRAKNLYFSLISFGVSINSSGEISEFPNTKDIENYDAKKELALKQIIEAYKKCNNYFPIKCYYPIIFNFRYSKAKFREVSIKQFEFFLEDILKFEKNNDFYKQIRYDIFYNDENNRLNNSIMTSRLEVHYVWEYLHELIELYLQEHQYDKIPRLLNKLIELNDTGAFISIVPEYFRRINDLDEGINFVGNIMKKYLENEVIKKGDDDYEIFKEKMDLLKHWKTLKPYKPRKVKKEEIDEVLITI